MSLHIDPNEPDRAGDQASKDSGQPPRPRPFGLRIAVYVLCVFLVQNLGGALILFVYLGADGFGELVEAQTNDGAVTLPGLIGFWLSVATTPLLLAVTAVFAAADRRTARDIGLAAPRGAGRWLGQPLVGAAVLAFLLGGWRLAAEQLATFRVADGFPADELESLGRWLPLDGAGIALFAASFLFLAFAGELMFRGYVYGVLRERLPWIHAAGLSALLFAFYQPGTPEVFAPSLLNVFLLGLLFAALREATGSLFLASLIHGTWNLSVACLLSLPLSGGLLPRLEHLEIDGPLWVTGGDYGLEGSWLLTGFLFAAVLAATFWVEKVAPSEDPAANDDPPDETGDDPHADENGR